MDEIRTLRVLIVEDSPVIGLAIEDMLCRLGFEVAGLAGNMASALEMAARADADAAIVDLNIRGSKAFSLLKILDERKIPFILASGYADWKMPEDWMDRPRLQKPFDTAQLAGRMAELLGGRTSVRSDRN